MGRSELYYYRTFFQWLESPDLGSGEEKGRQSDTPLHLTQYVLSAHVLCFDQWALKCTTAHQYQIILCNLIHGVFHHKVTLQTIFHT